MTNSTKSTRWSQISSEIPLASCRGILYIEAPRCRNSPPDSGYFFLNDMTIPEIRQKLQDLLVPILERRNAFLVDVVARSERGTKILQVYLDTDQGVTIDECAEISRELGRALAQDGSLQGPYNLEVSSPGMDRPLRLLRQFRKNIGRKFKVKYEGTEGTSTATGKLESIEEQMLTFSTDSGEPITLEFTRIIEAKEELPW